MDFGCACVCDTDYDGPKFCSEKWIKARVEHRCCECGEAIQKGEHYERVTGLWEEWETLKTCGPCRRIRTDVCCGGFEYGALRSVIMEVYGVDYVTGETDDDNDEVEQ